MKPHLSLLLLFALLADPLIANVTLPDAEYKEQVYDIDQTYTYTCATGTTIKKWEAFGCGPIIELTHGGTLLNGHIISNMIRSVQIRSSGDLSIESLNIESISTGSIAYIFGTGMTKIYDVIGYDEDVAMYVDYGNSGGSVSVEMMRYVYLDVKAEKASINVTDIIDSTINLLGKQITLDGITNCHTTLNAEEISIGMIESCNNFTAFASGKLAIYGAKLADQSGSNTITLSSPKWVIIGETVSGRTPDKLVGDFNVTYTGNGEDPGYGVDVQGWVQGNFNATAAEGSVNAGIITGNANVEAKSIYLSALLDGDLAFKASNTVTLVGNVSADDLLKIEGKLENGVETRANITFKGSLATGSTGTIHLHGKNVTGATEARETVNAAYIDIDASESVDIKHVFIGGDLVVKADKGVTLAAVGDAEHSVGAAELTCDNGGVTIGSFNGFSLSATAANDLTVLGSAVSMGEDMWGNTGDILLKGASVTTQAIASGGEVYLQGTSGDLTVQNDETKPSLDVGGSINAQLLDATAAGSISVAGDLTTDTGATLEAGGNISFDRNAVVRGSLDATAAGSVTMDGFFYDCETVDVKAGDAVKLGMVGALHIPVEIGGQEEDHPVGDANISSSNGPVTIFCFAGDTLNASAGGALTIEEADEDSGIVSTGEGKWSADGTERGPFAVRLVGSSISAQYITSTDAVYLQSTGGDYTSEGNELLPSIAVEGDVNTNALQATAAGSIELRGAVNIIGDGGPDSIIKTGGQVEFGDQLTVVGTTLNIMNISEAANLSVADVTIGKGATMGVYTGENTQEANEGTLTIADGRTLTAGVGARLNADLVMEDNSTLDVSAAEGIGGLLMGSTVTMSPGSVALSAADMAAVGNLGFMQAYDLFSGVDSFSIGGTAYSEITFSDEWVKAAEVFNNDLFQDGGKEYYLFYSGASQGGAGGNAGTVYLMQVPEPATSTLGLLALAALAARRRRK